MKNKKLLNLGCGQSYNNKWVNIDISPDNKSVLSWDVKKGIPFPNNYFDSVYCSHLLEHLFTSEADALVPEIYRVLKPSGVVRIVVPDLEQIISQYKKKLNSCLKSKHKKEVEQEYNWIYLELYDQAVRNRSGGEMVHFLRNSSQECRKYIINRIGQEGEGIIQTPQKMSLKSLYFSISSKPISWFVQRIKKYLSFPFLYPIGGKEYIKIFSDGLFYNSGEIHRHMYDRFSLGKMLKRHNFKKIQIMTASKSKIAKFNDYKLDTLGNNKIVKKPDSLFIEGIK
jgi:predicted SAM-dependent methyltransferase